MKKLYALLLVCFAVSTSAIAQELDEQNDMQRMQNQINEISEHLNVADQQALDQTIWKNRSKYFNLGYDMQTLSVGGDSSNSDIGASLSWGKTYYLHAKPILGMIKFGLDWSWFDLTYAQHKGVDTPSASYGVDDDDYNGDMYHLAIGMQFGPSVTINPVHHLKASLYFRVTPSYAMLGSDDFYSGYSTYCNFGISVAWKVLSIGFEQRWGSIAYRNDSKMDDSTTRIYFGFRF